MALRPPNPQAVVLFGASGDLAKKKVIPALYNLAVAGLLPERHCVIGFAMDAWDDETFRQHARESVETYSRTPLDEDVWKRFADSLSFISGTFDDEPAMGRLKQALEHADRDLGAQDGRLFYLAVPPSTFPTIVKSLASIGANTANSRIVVEKPFGHSLDSAKALSAEIHTAFDEHQLFRIDHYLGKETVQNLVVFRFANSIWERVWNRDAVDHVQITVAESIGVEGRAGYYEHAGAIRDLLQNHMLQVMAFLAMEPPRSLEAEAFRDEKVKLLKAVRPIDPGDVVRGQYDGYRKEEGVDPKSQTETFVAAKLWIDNWRWDGVPFFLRHGKKLPERDTEIAVYLRQAPDVLFRELEIDHIPSNHLTIRVQPDEGISLAFQVKIPGPGYELQTVRMDFDYDRSFMHALAEAYERLLHDAMTGDHTLFTREDGVERAWEIVTPILEQTSPLFFYKQGSWGPAQSDALIEPHDWHLRSRPAGVHHT
ncbi:MAG TPA: glucose-6-phosphate dehydrogenase [Actinomycetota bacterium]|nr:glucose-6-phosphate dehydrogenase [Actinomycetota bacterium]